MDTRMFMKYQVKEKSSLKNMLFLILQLSPQKYIFNMLYRYYTYRHTHTECIEIWKNTNIK